MKIIITGATGMAGSEVLKEALADNTFEAVTVIVRKPVTVTHPKLKTIIHSNFLDYSGLEQVFRDNDACIWCLGVSQNQVNEQDYVVITHDYVLAAAEAMLEANPSMSMLFLSGDGASTTEQSRFLFGRVKGKTENALVKLPFKKVFMARPAGIVPSSKADHLTFTLRMQYLLVGIMQYVTPGYVITSRQLAKALLHVVKNGAPNTILPYKYLKRLAKEIQA